MPYNPIDPASLEGEDLTNWYLRSPQEIEQQRQAAAQQRYSDFFYGGSSGRAINGSPHSHGYSPSAADADLRDVSAPVLDAASYLASAGPAPEATCPACHGSMPHLPSGWNPFFPSWPITRDIIGGGGGSKPPEPGRKQCEIQAQNDARVCNGIGNNRRRAGCFEQLEKRRSHCQLTGEVGEPDLLLPCCEEVRIPFLTASGGCD